MEPVIQWMPVLLGGFLGGLLVYLTGLFVDGWREKWRIRHYRSALTAEIDECHRLAGVRPIKSAGVGVVLRRTARGPH